MPSRIRGVGRWLLVVIVMGFIGVVGTCTRKQPDAPEEPLLAATSPEAPAAEPDPLITTSLGAAEPQQSGPPATRSARFMAALRPGRWLAIAAALVSVAVLLIMEIQAIGNHYELRVTADTPTFLALIRDMALHPLAKVSVFFGNAGSDSIHASPYLQLLAWTWKALATPSQFWNPISLGEFAAIVTIPASLFVLAMLWLYVRRLAGGTAAWASIPIVLSLFGPAHVIYAGDMSINGFLTTGYFPSTVATGLMLATVVAYEHRRRWSTAVATVMAALTLTADPFGGLMLVLVLILHACAAVTHDPCERWRMPSVLAAGAVLAAAWPAMDTLGAYSSAGAPLPGLVLVAALAPTVWLEVRRRARLAPMLERVRNLDAGPMLERRIAELGFWATAALAIWALYVIGHWPSGAPALRSYRLGFYWNDQRDRWLVLLLPGVCGLLGLWRGARGGRAAPLLWFAAVFTVGLVGAVVHLATGHELPLYYRLILASQLPLAVGAAIFVARPHRRMAVVVMALTLTVAFAFKVLTLETESPYVDYFGDPLGTLWSFNRIIPRGPGIVASDPAIGYFMPVMTGHRVLTFSKGHADSGNEQSQAQAGYGLLRRVYGGSGVQASQALGRMWSLGVRWVVVEKFTNFDPATQQQLFAAPYTSLITATDVNRLALYNSRLTAVGVQTYDDQEFTVYRLSRAMLSNATSGAASIAQSKRGDVASALHRLAETRGPAPAALRHELARDGVRTVTLSYGEFGSIPTLSAYGRSLTESPVVVRVSSGRWQVDCSPQCNSASAAKTITSLGPVLHSDGRFSTIVRLS